MAAAMVSSTRIVADTEAQRAAQAYLDSRLTNGGPKSDQQTASFTIPSIDISPSFSPSLKDRQAVAAQIHAACTTSGFFTITGHGVPESTRQGILHQAQRFFHTLPPDKKQALHIKHSPFFRGWEPADYTYVNPSDWDSAERAPETKEGFNWGYETGLDPSGGDGKYVELDGTDGTASANAWPAEEDLPGFYAGVREYYSRILELARHLCRLFALSLHLEETYFDAMTTHPGGIARLLHYPVAAAPSPSSSEDVDEPTNPPNKTDASIGLGAHSDYECFTILLSHPTAGLEILSPGNAWVPAPTVPDSFTVNVGDFLMRWTNDRYRSTVHRVVNDQGARAGAERWSVPFFFSVNYDQVVETLASCVGGDGAEAKYPPVRAGEYILARLRATAKDG